LLKTKAEINCKTIAMEKTKIMDGIPSL
jgi:hypothetical protein